MRKKLFLAVFLLLGSAALKAQQYEMAPLMSTIAPRIYPTDPKGESNFYILDLSGLPQQTKKGDGKGFKMNKISLEDFMERKWTKDEKIQELFFSSTSNAEMNLVILMPAEMTSFARTRRFQQADFIPAVECGHILQNLPSRPAIPASPLK